MAKKNENKLELSKATINSLLKSQITKEIKYTDNKLSGFGIRLRPSGKHVFYYEYTLNGVTRYVTIGQYGVITPDEARKIAIKNAADVYKGIDLQEEKIKNRKKADKLETVNQLIDYYIQNGHKFRPNKRRTSWEKDKSCLLRHVSKLIGHKKLIELSPQVVSEWQLDVVNGKSASIEVTGKRGKAVVKGGIYAAARSYSALSVMIRWAMQLKIMDTNPLQGVSQVKGKPRDRALSNSEYDLFWSKIDDINVTGHINENAKSIIKLLMLTGARQSEIRELRWNEINLENATILLQPERHKNGKNNVSKTIYLSEPAIKILEKIEKKGDFVFRQLNADKPIAPISKQMRALSLALGIDNFHTHLARHTVVSRLSASGVDIALIGKALGQKQINVTYNYFHPDKTKLGDVMSKLQPK